MSIYLLDDEDIEGLKIKFPKNIEWKEWWAAGFNQALTTIKEKFKVEEPDWEWEGKIETLDRLNLEIITELDLKKIDGKKVKITITEIKEDK